MLRFVFALICCSYGVYGRNIDENSGDGSRDGKIFNTFQIVRFSVSDIQPFNLCKFRLSYFSWKIIDICDRYNSENDNANTQITTKKLQPYLLITRFIWFNFEP